MFNLSYSYVPASGVTVKDGQWHLEHLVVDHQPEGAIVREDALETVGFDVLAKFDPLEDT